jgi:valyl-tRNA synthetase
MNSILPHISKQIESKFAEQRKVQEREINESRMKKAQQDMIDGFIKSHPTMSNEELQAVAKFGDERGIAQIEDAYTLMTLNQEKNKAKTEGVKQVTEKLTQAEEVPTTLSNATGGNKTAIDFDNLMQSDWEKLPEDVRRQALMDSSSG